MLFLTSLLVGLAAQEEERELNSTLSAVTVFIRDAFVTHQCDPVQLPGGTSKWVLKGLSPYLDESSIQVRSEGDFVVRSVNQRRSFQEAARRTSRQEDRLERRQVLEDSIRQAKNELATLDQEMAFLKENQSIGGANTGYQLESLQEIRAYYGDQLRAIRSQYFATEKTVRELEKNLEQLNAEIEEAGGNPSELSMEVIIEVAADRATTAEFTVTYLVGRCGWNPTYDLKVASVDSTMTVVQKANVYQNTGEDWNLVQLTFSNKDPNLGSVRPWLPPYYLREARASRRPLRDYTPVADVGIVRGRIVDDNGEPLIGASILAKGTTTGTVTDLDGRYELTIPEGASTLVISYTGFGTKEVPIYQSEIDAIMNEDAAALEEVVVSGVQGRTSGVKARSSRPARPVNQAVALENRTSLEFTLQSPFTVPSDGKVRDVQLRTLEVPADYLYEAVPKITEGAFLTAQLSNWEQYQLLEGEANLYFENTYLGRTVLDTRYLLDTLTISLGQDPSILLDRQPTVNFRERQFIGNKVTETIEYRIRVRNTKSQPIQITIFDQVPISQEKGIAVEVEELSNGLLNEDSGEVIWKLRLPGGASEALLLRYSVKYPKGRGVYVE